MEIINEQKNSEIRPENIDYKEFWGHSISKNRYLKEKQTIEDHQTKIKERVEWVENLVYEYLTDQRGVVKRFVDLCLFLKLRISFTFGKIFYLMKFEKNFLRKV